jgi:hypothetical protein
MPDARYPPIDLGSWCDLAADEIAYQTHSDHYTLCCAKEFKCQLHKC